ncbi:MAG: hypothetical protein U0L12_00705 [Ruminococcus sp.]|nr:hypothetical protein [Ruminococcus sp.]
MYKIVENQAVCNKCGRKLFEENGIVKEGSCDIIINWGYFSEKDGENHRITLCEPCYDNWIKEFQIPVTITDNTELI